MMLVFSHSITPRLTYILSEILDRRLGIAYQLTTDWHSFSSHTGEKINYSNRTSERGIHILPHALLVENSIQTQVIQVTQDAHWRYTFFQQEQGNLPFDLFAAAFYLMSRYEEYVHFSADMHQRFKHELSLAYTSGFLLIPLIDFWCVQFKTLLLKVYPTLTTTSHQYKHLSTFDIDFAFRYKGLGLIRQCKKMGKSLLDGRINDAVKQLNVVVGMDTDPYDTYDYIQQVVMRHQLKPMYFVLMRGDTAFDKNTDSRKSGFKALLHKLSQHATIGLHPSYFSSDTNALLSAEKNRLESIIGHTVTASRQHYLRFRLPDTYRMLIDSGIQSDYSMMYANHCGFRASTCLPFVFFDLNNNQQTALTVTPPCVMDTALRFGMKKSCAESLLLLDEIIHEIKLVNGYFVSIWHNSNLGNEEGWQNWKEVFEYMHR